MDNTQNILSGKTWPGLFQARFPDGWTMYGASGKEMSDNARYMALGNSIAVPCAERVFIGICKVDRERRGGSGQERPGT